jgi:hypothetical protein
MTNIPKDTTIIDKSEVNEAEIAEIKKSIKDAIINYGILPADALYILEGIFTD